MKTSTKKIFIVALILVLTSVLCLFAACVEPEDGQHTVTLRFGLDLPDKTVTIEHGGTLTLAQLSQMVPQTDYQFHGWKFSEGTEVSADVVAYNDVVLIARWFATYQIEYYLVKEDGSFEKSAELTAEKSSELGETVAIEATEIAGYVFDEENSQNVLSAPLDSANVVLKLYYKRNVVNVAFDKNLSTAAGLMESVSVSSGEYVLPACTFTSPYKFAGWSLTPAGDEVLSVGSSVQLQRGVTLYARWQTAFSEKIFVEGNGGTYAEQAPVERTGVIGSTVTSEANSPDGVHFLDDSHPQSVTSAVLSESGTTLFSYFTYKTFTVTYFEDGTAVSAKYGTKIVVRTCAEPNAVSYCTAQNGNGREYAYGSELTVEGDVTLYPLYVDKYTDKDGSGDVLELRRGMTGLGSAKLVKSGGETLSGFVSVENDVVSFEIYVGDGEICGKIYDETTFVYRGEEEGFYLYFDPLFPDDGAYSGISLALDGYGTGVLARLADDGERIENFFVTYANSGEGDFAMQYFLPARPNDVYSGYFKVFSAMFEGYDEVDGYFEICGTEYGTYGLFYNYQFQKEALSLDGYGGAKVVYFDSSGAQQTANGNYVASENYEYGQEEYLFVPSAGSAIEPFYFVLTYTDDGSETINLFLIKRGEAGLYSQLEAGLYPQLQLDGYGTGIYYADEDDAGRVARYTVETSAEYGFTLLLTFIDEAGGRMQVRLNSENGLFVPLGDFVIDENNVLTSYVGDSSVITIPEGVVKIAANAFKDVNLTSVILPTTLTEIGDYAFQNSASATQQSLLKTVRFLSVQPPVLGEGVFRWQTGDFKIYVPNGSEQAYRTAESWQNYAQYVTSDEEQGNKPLYEVKDGVLVSYNNKDADPQNVAVTIPDGVTEIASGVFANIEYITSVNLNGVTVIGSDAFYGCLGLKTITFNDNTESIGDEAFYQCSALTEVDLKNVKTIGQLAFACCFALQKVQIGANIKSIGSRAFYYCAVQFGDTEDDVTPMDLVLTFAGDVAPAMGSAVFMASQPRLYAASYEAALNFATADGWAPYSPFLRVKNDGETVTWYDQLSMGSLLILDDRILFEDGSFYGLYKWSDGMLFVTWLEYSSLTQTLETVSQIGSVGSDGSLTGLSFYDVAATFVPEGTTATFNSDGGESLTVTYGRSNGVYNGNPVTVEIQNYRSYFDFEGYRYAFTLLSGGKFTYERHRIEQTLVFAADDGSSLTMRVGDYIYANGQLKDVDGLTLNCETWSWYLTDVGGGVYTWRVSYLSKTYVITAVTSGEKFTYTWQIASTSASYRAANGDVAVFVYAADGSVASIRLMFSTANGYEQSLVQFSPQGEDVYAVTVDFLVESFDEEGNSLGSFPSQFNGNYLLTIDRQNNSFTLVPAN